FAMAKPGVDLADVERIINEEMERFLKKGPTKEELKRVKNQRLADFVRGIQRIGGFGGKSDILIENEVYGGDPGFYKTTLERVQNVSAVELRDTAIKWLSTGDFTLEVHPFPSYKTAESDLDRSQKPDTDQPPLAKFPSFERTKLENGLSVLVANYPAAPIVRFRLAVDAGYAADQFTVPGAASMTMSMLDEGTSKRDALEISDELLALGTDISAGANLDQCSVFMDTLKTNLDESMELYLDILFHPAFPEKELERLKKERLAAIQQEKTEPNSMALRVLPKLLYGEGHAYNLPMTGSGTEESIEKLETSDLKKFYETWFKPNNATLIVTGDVTLDEILPTLEKAFGKWQAGDTPEKNLSKVEMPNETSVYLIDKPGSSQSVIFAGQVAPPEANPDEFEIEMVQAVMGGKFTSRLNMNLREDKHWSYGVSLRIPGAEGQRPLYVQAPVQTDKTKEAMVEIQKEIQAVITNRPPTEDEIDVTKTNKTLKLTGQWETISSVESSLNEIVRFNLPDDYYSTYAKKVMALEEPKVASVAKELIHPDKMIWVIVGDRAKIEDGIKELNYGPLRYLDADGNFVE
ncbi:insulinase family protein, partial [bacterium]|nr:insulinase family protein [bacterium]